MKKLASVVAVPDPRTQSLLVSASKDLMPQIEDMVTQLDDQASGVVHSYAVPLANAEVMDVMQILQDLYPQGQTSTRQNNTQNNPLMSRAQTMQQTFNSQSGSSTTSTAGGGGGRTAVP